MIGAPGYSVYDQWAAQSQAIVQNYANVLFHSSLPDETIRGAMLTPVRDPSAAVRAVLAEAGDGATCAVFPRGPYVVPYSERQRSFNAPTRYWIGAAMYSMRPLCNAIAAPAPLGAKNSVVAVPVSALEARPTA